MKQAVIYALRSVRRMRLSVKEQISRCRNFAQSEGLVISHTCWDAVDDISEDELLSLKQLIFDSKNAEWEVVLVFAADGLGKNLSASLENAKTLKENGKEVIFVEVKSFKDYYSEYCRCLTQIMEEFI